MGTKSDPDFFGVIESTAALLAGLQAAVALAKPLLRGVGKRPDSTIQSALREAADLVRYIEVDVQVIRDVVAEAEIPGSRAFRPGRRAFLASDQFKRYERSADQLLGRLRGVLKATNRLYRTLPASDLSSGSPIATLEGARGRLERVIYDREHSIDDALRDLEAGIAEIKQALSKLIGHGTKT